MNVMETNRHEQIFFVSSSRRHRRHQMNSVGSLLYKNERWSFFSQGTVDFWDSLPRDIGGTESLHALKEKLD